METILGVIGSILTASILGVAKWFANFFKKQFNMVLRKLEMNHIQYKATDYALEKSIGNGYSRHKKEKLDELIKIAQYVNTEDFQ